MNSYITTYRLDNAEWFVGTDPGNEGIQLRWHSAPPPERRRIPIPGVVQYVFAGYHGVAWYWTTFAAPVNPHADGTYLLRFGAVDYLAEVWLNGVRLGIHEGAEEPFELDASVSIQPAKDNLLALRVLNPTHEEIDGISLGNAPVGRRDYPVPNDCAYNTGGITGSVELIIAPSVRITNLRLVPDWKTGIIHAYATVWNSTQNAESVHLLFTVETLQVGAPLTTTACSHTADPGAGAAYATISLPDFKLWELYNPFLYRVCVSLRIEASGSIDVRSARCGFRDFRFVDGYFRLNGRRIRLHGCLYIVLQYPIQQSVPHTEDFVRRDVVNTKAMGFNTVRITCGAAHPAWQLDVFDELGLLVIEEHFGAHGPAKSEAFSRLWQRSISGVIKRDRNHPSIVAWSLLNEVADGPLFRYAAGSLQSIRELDGSRMVLLNSGRFDGDETIGSVSNPESYTWEDEGPRDLHSYPQFPHTAETIRGMRGIDSIGKRTHHGYQDGDDMRPILLSEYGVCGAENYSRFLRHFERLNQTGAGDAKVYQQKYRSMQEDWLAFGLDACWACPEDYFEDSHRNMAKLVLDDFNAWMANPRIVGALSSTQINDAWFHGCGVTNYFRELKPGMADVYADMSAKVRWCLFVEPQHAYRGSTVNLEAVLCTDDSVAPGQYPAKVQIIDPGGNPVLAESFAVEIADSIAAGVEPPFARIVYTKDLRIDGPSGCYRFRIGFEHGMAADGEVLFFVGDGGEMPPVPPPIALWGKDPDLEKWLSERDIDFCRHHDADPTVRQTIIVSGVPENDAPRGFSELAGSIATGSCAVFLDPITLIDGEVDTATYPRELRWAPFPARSRPSMVLTPSWYFRADHWAKNHPVFEGLPSGGIMDYRFYREIIDDRVLENVPLPAEVVCGTMYASGPGYSANPVTTIHDLCAGKFILTTLRIRENLGAVPAAERLLRNMLRHVAQSTGRPATRLPRDWDARLREMGY